MNNKSKSFTRFNILSWETDNLYHAIALSFGLSDSAMNIMYILSYENGKAPLSYICRYSGLQKQTVNSALRKLEEEGLIKLESINGKEKSVVLTESGKEKARSTVDHLIDWENNIITSFDEKDFSLLLAMNEKYLIQLKAHLTEFRDKQNEN